MLRRSNQSLAGAFVFQGDQAPQCRDWLGGQVAWFSRTCPDRKQNEDAGGILDAGDGTGVLVVADGCGGMAQGDVASQTAVSALASHLHDLTSDDLVRAAVLNGFEQANGDVLALGTGAATTLAIAQVDHDSVRPYHVGDSQILLVGNRGKVKLETVAHSPVSYAVEAGILSKEDAIHHEDRHLVSNIVGSRDTHIEVGPHRPIALRDTLLVGSDGLFDNLRIHEIVSIIRKGPLQKAICDLSVRATERMDSALHSDQEPSKPDDITVILYRPRRGGPLTS